MSLLFNLQSLDVIRLRFRRDTSKISDLPQLSNNSNFSKYSEYSDRQIVRIFRQFRQFPESLKFQRSSGCRGTTSIFLRFSQFAGGRAFCLYKGCKKAATQKELRPTDFRAPQELRGHNKFIFRAKKLQLFTFSPRENLTFNFKLWYNLKKRQKFFIKKFDFKNQIFWPPWSKKEGRTFRSPRSFQFRKLTISG